MVVPRCFVFVRTHRPLIGAGYGTLQNFIFGLTATMVGCAAEITFNKIELSLLETTRSHDSCGRVAVGASKFLGVQRIFAEIFPNLPKKLLCNLWRPFFYWPPKNGLPLFFCKRWALFFEVKQRWAPFLPRFLGIFPGFSSNQNLGVRLHPRLLHHCAQWRNLGSEPGGANFSEGGPLAIVWVCNN